MTARVAFALLLGLAGGASAASIPSTVSTAPGAALRTDGLSGFATTGASMAGLQVTAFFENGAAETVGWAATGTRSGGGTGSGWSLVQPGDTFVMDWTLANLTAATIVGFFIDGQPGNTVFDIVRTPVMSPRSSSGDAFRSAWTSDPSQLTGAAAVYSGPLHVDGVFHGDLFGALDVRFGGIGLTQGNVFRFRADTDTAVSEIVPVPSPIAPVTAVPTPASLAIFGAALLGLGIAHRRD